jgi:hypothetical protein
MLMVIFLSYLLGFNEKCWIICMCERFLECNMVVAESE